MKNKEPDEDKIREACSSVGQDQIFRFWKELNPTERKALLFQLNTIDFEESKLAWEDIRRKNKEILLPEPPNFKSPDKAPEADYSDMYEQGEEMLRQGKVAAFTVAGGQGTRLGHDGPKGTFCCTPITQKSLFEHFAQYMKFFSKRYGVSPRWFIMTSQENHIQTKQYFHANDYFGLDINRVVFLSRE